MIGIDTNVLLRHILEDDVTQSPIATAFLMHDSRVTEPALVNPVLLVELVWTLMRRESFGKPDILDLLDVLVRSRRIAFTDERAVIAAIEGWRRGKADFPDYLICHLNRQAGATTTMTFDGDAAMEPGFSRLTA
ncbi:type II toxin-antitoxin system VapC family toxin [Methylobacterium sp. W2]|uniref:PIN domain-containing protein n=1 Tax=Methylobacterium sp. W2 TaxID=2598107 RepID=UPI001D0C6D7F|nr:type II toxin-antitoxin system VapC family toxin [Methylobacterium sp. W2]MCC0808751.1 type II toxin-antitoxin system VapC family toxin [Methylobacterium sp. W2]